MSAPTGRRSVEGAVGRGIGAAVAVVVALGLLATGCRRPVTGFSSTGGISSPELDASGDFDLAMGVLFRLEQFEPMQARQQILYDLNQWAKKQPPNVEWIGDPMFNQLPSKYPESQSPELLAEARFQLFDVFMLQESVWMRDIAQWVSGGPVRDPLIRPWLEELPGTRGADHAEQVGVACKLFDWVVRNIQLDPLEPPDAEVSEETLADPHPPGSHYAWESLLLGHGDYLERSRIFILLARQRHLPVVMLGIQESDQPTPRPWVAAALVDQDLYLFDLRLGLPIPGPGGRGVATLEQLRQEPELLAQLHGEEPYPVDQGDLKRVIAQIDATPAFLSQRMKMVEANLTGDQKLVLSIAATPLRRKLDSCPGLAGVRLWTQPYDSLQYHRELPSLPTAYAHFTREMYPFDHHTPLEQGRILHFRGQFDEPEDPGRVAHGAKFHYLQSRVPDAEIEQVGKERADGTGGDSVQGADPALRARAIQAAQRVVLRTKQAASYWLGLIAFDTGDYRVAVDFLQRRTLEHSPDGPWSQGARYNLARSLEAIGVERREPQRLREAQELLRQDRQSPQAAGNGLRADRLEELIRQLETDPPANSA